MFRIMKCMIAQPKYVAPEADMTDQTVVLTGPTRGGIGYETALELASRGARLILGARNKERGEDAVASIHKELRAKYEDIYDRIECHICDVSDISSVRTFCETIKENAVDVLISNAGAQFPKYATNADGIELTFATCVLGHHLMTHLLTPKRLVWITGDIYIMAKGDPSPTTSASSHQAYMRACLARLWVASQWKKRVPGTAVVCVHPGVIATEFAKPGNGFMRSIASKLLIDATQGAQAGIMAASSPVDNLNQEWDIPYFHNKFGWFELPPMDYALNEEKAKALFNECDLLCDIQRS